MKAKIIARPKLAQIVARLKRQSKIVVSTNGCFDILHAGHVEYLERAKRLGDILIVGVNSDASVRCNKGPRRPINNERDRAEVLAALESVDYIFIFNEKTPIEWLRKIKPDIHVKGADRNLSAMPERIVLKQMGARLVRLPYRKGKSTTAIIEKIVQMYRS